ncbi:MAG: CDP-alcohol phosphatidyltransferase family protein [Halobacteriota archaeon]|nr:CDP-alcohol phosphatidyltransferase family protein [Halobacteriota archaeon]
MALDSLRPYLKDFLESIAKAFAFVGLTPNTLSTISLVMAAIGGVSFYYSRDNHDLLLLAGLMVFLSGFLDAIDGALARYTKKAGLKGDFLDHVIDRYADVFFICGIFFGAYAPWEIGVVAITGVLICSYLGTQAQAVNIGRYYGGILGRADRLVLLILFTFLNYVAPGEVYGLPLLGWLLVIFAITSHISAIQRFVYIWRKLSD